VAIGSCAGSTATGSGAGQALDAAALDAATRGTAADSRRPHARRADRRDDARGQGFRRTLGAAVTAGTLPFAGLPLWAAVLSGLAAVSIGGALLYLRRRLAAAVAA
jgi:hypothetical protein